MTVDAPRSGIDLSHVDPTIRPQDDLFGTSTAAGWPNTRYRPTATDGAFRELYDRAEEQVHDIITAVARTTGRNGTDEQRIGDLYASSSTRTPSRDADWPHCCEELASIDGADGLEVLARCWEACNAAASAAGSAFTSTPIPKTPPAIWSISTSPGWAYPTSPTIATISMPSILGAYPAHIARMFALVFGGSPDEYADRAGRIVAVETSLPPRTGTWCAVAMPTSPTTSARSPICPPAHPAFDWAGWMIAPAHRRIASRKSLSDSRITSPLSPSTG